jgi:hypothetical protein
MTDSTTAKTGAAEVHAIDEGAIKTGATKARSTEEVMRDYLHAKDENRPLYMARAFTPDANLRMVLKTESISFPSEAIGEAAITDALVRKFGQTYENVYTFYLSRPAAGAALPEFQCDWLVGMTEKANGNVRVGCGSYDWKFQAQPHHARALAITIEAMETLPADKASDVLGWLTALPYPWADRAAVSAGAPAIDALAPVLAYLNRGAG